jgi:hypothetical protein
VINLQNQNGGWKYERNRTSKVKVLLFFGIQYGKQDESSTLIVCTSPAMHLHQIYQVSPFKQFSEASKAILEYSQKGEIISVIEV